MNQALLHAKELLVDNKDFEVKMHVFILTLLVVMHMQILLIC